jgi:predicted transport protein
LKNNKYNLINTIYKTNEGYNIQIIDYINKDNVVIKFCDFPVTKVCTMQNIVNGQIKNPYHKSVLNIGYFGIGDYTSRLNGEKTLYYTKWISMMNRCYSDNVHKVEKTYEKCEVYEGWHNFQNFAKWCDMHIYPCEYRLELDKDLFIENNTIYSPYACCFFA